MNELERAATALRDRPVAAPAPLEAIERRAGALRRRRRLVEVGAVALVALVLGTAGFALSAARNDRDDQGVFVGQGPSTPASSSVSTYQLTSPVDDATAEALEQAIEARFRWAWAGDAVAKVDGTEVTVTAAAPIPSGRFDALVTSPGGFELRFVGAEAPEAECRSVGGGDGSPQAMWTSAIAGPPRCVFVDPPIDLPSPAATESGISASAAGGYQTDLILTTAASHAYLAATTTCSAGSDAACGRSTIGIVTDGAILQPSAPVSVSAGNGDGANIVHLAVTGFTDHADAEVWAAVLVHALPEGVQLTRIADDSGATSTTRVSTTVEAPTGAYSRILCLKDYVDTTAMFDVAAELQARFADIGRTVSVEIYYPTGGGGAGVGCPSGLMLRMSSDYPSSDADWVRDQFALLQPGILRSSVGGAVLHPISAVSRGGDASTEGRPNVVIELPADEFDAMNVSAASAQCVGQWACWLGVDIDGAIPTSDLAREAPPHSIVLVLAPGEDGHADRIAALLSHPLPEGASFQS